MTNLIKNPGAENGVGSACNDWDTCWSMNVALTSVRQPHSGNWVFQTGTVGATMGQDISLYQFWIY